jgi:hypothetical protein
LDRREIAYKISVEKSERERRSLEDLGAEREVKVKGKAIPVTGREGP